MAYPTQQTFSKRIGKAEDACKEVIIEALGNDPTYGFDIDSIYYFAPENRWAVLEFLKCDHPSVDPASSHPSRYWAKNWQKFASLWRAAQGLNAEFYLINYEDSNHATSRGRALRQFTIIRVHDMNPISTGGILRETKHTFDENEFFQWFRDFNSRGQQRL